MSHRADYVVADRRSAAWPVSITHWICWGRDSTGAILKLSWAVSRTLVTLAS